MAAISPSHSTDHPPSLSLSTLPLLILPSSRWTQGCFSFSPSSQPPPPASFSSFHPALPLLFLRRRSSASATARSPDFHTPATALPAQVEGGNTHPPACSRAASAPACTTRCVHVYMHCNFIGRPCWLPKTSSRGSRTHTRTPRIRSHPLRLLVPEDQLQAVIETPETRIYFTTSPFPTPKHHQNGREAVSPTMLFLARHDTRFAVGESSNWGLGKMLSGKDGSGLK